MIQRFSKICDHLLLVTSCKKVVVKQSPKVYLYIFKIHFINYYWYKKQQHYVQNFLISRCDAIKASIKMKTHFYFYLKPISSFGCLCAGTQGHMDAVFDLAWSPHSLRLVSVSGDHTAILWDVSGHELSPLGMFEGHTRSVKAAAFHPTDASELILCAYRVWEMFRYFFK